MGFKNGLDCRKIKFSVIGTGLVEPTRRKFRFFARVGGAVGFRFLFSDKLKLNG